MAKIELNYTNEELTTLLDGLNNAYIALKDVYTAGLLGCQVPKAFRPLFEEKTFDQIEEFTQLRLGAVEQLYKFLLAYEK